MSFVEALAFLLQFISAGALFRLGSRWMDWIIRELQDLFNQRK